MYIVDDVCGWTRSTRSSRWLIPTWRVSFSSRVSCTRLWCITSRPLPSHQTLLMPTPIWETLSRKCRYYGKTSSSSSLTITPCAHCPFMSTTYLTSWFQLVLFPPSFCTSCKYLSCTSPPGRLSVHLLLGLPLLFLLLFIYFCHQFYLRELECVLFQIQSALDRSRFVRRDRSIRSFWWKRTLSVSLGLI